MACPEEGEASKSGKFFPPQNLFAYLRIGVVWPGRQEQRGGLGPAHYPESSALAGPEIQGTWAVSAGRETDGKVASLPIGTQLDLSVQLLHQRGHQL